MRRDLLITFITTIFVVIFNLLIYRLINLDYGENDFAIFSIIKRNLGIIQPLIYLGINVSLARNLQFYKSDDSNYFISAISIILIAASLLSLIFLLFKDSVINILFGSESLVYISFPFLVLCIGFSFEMLTFSYYRGKAEMLKANCLQLNTFVVVPIFAFLTANNIISFVLYYGISLIAINSLLFFLIINREKFCIKAICKYFKVNLKYGIQRIPGDWGIQLLLTLPVLFFAQTENIVNVGYFAFSLTILSMINLGLKPVGIVFLPRISNSIVNKEYKSIYKTQFIIALVSFIVGLLFYYILNNYSKVLLDLYLQNYDSNLVLYLKGISFSTIGFTYYILNRSIIDAIYEVSYNSINVFITLSFFILLTFLPVFEGVFSILDLVVISYTTLGILTFIVSVTILITMSKNG